MFKPVHARLGRAALGWSLNDLEGRTGISKNTLVRFEAGGGVHNATVEKIANAFAKEGLSFLYEDDARGPGLLLSKELSRRLEQRPQTAPKKERRDRMKASK